MIATEEKHSLSNTVDQDNCGQGPANREDHQEKKGGGGRAKRPQCRPTVMDQCDLRRESGIEDMEQGWDKTKEECWLKPSPLCVLFTVSPSCSRRG